MIELIAEIGINHNGDMSIVKKLIDIAHSVGFQYVKFQKRTIEEVYTKEELDTPRESPWGTTNREQKIGLEIPVKGYEEIDRYCMTKGIKWFASPWDAKSVFLITQLGSCFCKIPSALITNHGYLEVCRDSGLPIILSTGMSTLSIIDDAVGVLGRNNIHAILHCTSTYPSKNNELNIRCIPILKNRYPFAKIGFSNHHPGLLGMILAMAYGAEMIELHTTLDRSMYGSDQASSIEPEGVYKIAKYAKGISDMLGDGKKVIYDSELPIIRKLRK